MKFLPISLALGLVAALAACNTASPSQTPNEVAPVRSGSDSSSDLGTLKAQAINKLMKASGPNGWNNLVQEGVAVVSGKYTASFRIKGAGEVTLRFYEGSWGKQLVNLPCVASSVWRTCTIPVQMGVNPKFTFAITNSGPTSTPTFIDDAALTDATGKNILLNGNFEAAAIAPWWFDPAFTLVTEDTGTVQPPLTGTTVWKNVEIGGGGMVTGLVVHPKVPNVVFARTDVGGAYRWSETTGSWTPLMDQFTRQFKGYVSVDSLALDPNNANVVYASVGGSNSLTDIGETAILKSTNSGTTWTAIRRGDFVTGNGNFRVTGERINVDPTNSNHIVYGTRTTGLYESTNGGSSFTRIANVPIGQTIIFQVWDGQKYVPVPAYQGVAWVQFDKTGTAYAAVAKAGIYRGVGGVWTKISPAALNGEIPTRASIASDGTLYAAYMSPDGEDYSPAPGFVYRYRAGVWTNITPPAGNWKPNAVTVSPTDPNYIMVTPLNGLPKYVDIWYSRDAGASWKSIPFDTGRLTSKEGWLTSGEFVFISQSLQFDATNPKRMWGTSGVSVWRSDNIDQPDTATFFTQSKGIAETIDFTVATPPGSKNTYIGVGDVCGMKWSNLDVTPSLKDRFYAEHMNCVDVVYSEKIPTAMAVVGRNGYFGEYYGATSRDAGLTWQQFNAPYFGYTAGRIAISSTDPQNMVWAGQGAPIYFTKNGGQTWAPAQGRDGGAGPGKPVFNDPWTPVWPLAADPERAGVFYSYGSYGDYNQNNLPEVYRSEDGGATWKTMYSFPQGFFIDVHLRSTPGRAGHLWMGTAENGGYRSTDGGATWQPLAGFTSVRDVSLGKPQTPTSYPTVFAMGTRAGILGVYRSLDEGKTWVLITPNSNQNVLGTLFKSLTADRNVFGRVFVATDGRGTFYGTLK
jgi:xyloglucan-specific exo-beta-1,4-glucanase